MYNRGLYHLYTSRNNYQTTGEYKVVFMDMIKDLTWVSCTVSESL